MKRLVLVFVVIALSLIAWTSQILASVDPGAAKPTVILVDKAKNSLQVAEYDEQGYRILKSYHTTVGRVKGDKEDEGDLKTPEGIYRFTSLLTPPILKKKFGVMAFYMDFPNPYDRLAGRTGSDIMLHATDQPTRLEKDFDSKGCIVVNNKQIEEIKGYVRLNLTPILVFDRLEDHYLKPKSDSALVSFFQNWIAAWENRRIDDYMSHYHSEFQSAGKGFREWRAYKNALNQRYTTIEVSPSDIVYLRHPKYNVVQFTQNYVSRFKSGAVAHRSIGTKTLYVAEESGSLRIIDEDFTRLKW